MAVRYAVATGNWNTESTWNNGTTLGIPTSGDEVYLNGFNVTVSTTNITCGTIRNDLFADTGNSGGKLIVSSSSNTTISSNLIAENTIVTLDNNITLTVNGDITCLHSSGTAAIARSGSATIVINGNVTSNGGYLYSATGNDSTSITINGNITISGGTLLSYATAPTVLLNNGTITLNSANIINISAIININSSVLPQSAISRMQNALTVDIFQQILDAHLNN